MKIIKKILFGIIITLPFVGLTYGQNNIQANEIKEESQQKQQPSRLRKFLNDTTHFVVSVATGITTGYFLGELLEPLENWIEGQANRQLEGNNEKLKKFASKVGTKKILAPATLYACTWLTDKIINRCGIPHNSHVSKFVAYGWAYGKQYLV